MPLPQGYTIDQPQDAVKLPPGYTLDAQPTDQPQSSLQKFQQKMDESVATPADTRNNGLPNWVNQVGDAYYGMAQGIERPLVHPVEAAAGAVQSVLHPIDTLKSAYSSFKQSPGLAVGQMVGSAPLYAAGGEALAPIARAAGAGTSRALLMGRTPEGAYESALKPSTTLSATERAAAVKTGLENNLTISKGGLQNLSNLIDDYNTKIKAEISSDPTRPINTVPALRNLDSVRAKFANQVTPQPDLADIDQVHSNFLANSKVAPHGAGPAPASLSAADAQAMKQGTYQALGSKAYGEVKGASIEAQKALARGLKDEIANQFPEIKNLNAQESKLLDLQPILERAVNRTANHQLIGIGTPAVSAAARAVTGSGPLAAAAGLAKAVLDDPFVKSRLAISLSKGARIPLAQASARVQAYATALGSTSAVAQGTLGGQTGSE